MKRWKKSLAGMMVAFMVVLQFGALAAAEPASTAAGSAQESASKKITIVHFNDVHSRVDETADSFGYAKISGVVKEYREANPNTLVLDTGDSFHGQTIANLVQGESILNILNTIGVDAMATGNHDYNYGYNRLLELAEKADFAVLAANVYKGDVRLLEPYIIKEMDGVKVAVFGLATPETLFKTHPKNVEGLTFTDPSEEAKKVIAELDGKADVIVALAHLGLDDSSVDTSRKLAEDVPQIDVIIDGHSHTKLDNGLLIGDVLIAQAGEYGEQVGVVNITVDADNKVSKKTAFLLPREYGNTVFPDKAVSDIISEVRTSQEGILSEVVGKSSVDLEGAREKVRVGETNLGNLITDAMLEETGADIAITNGGGIRASIPAGDITKGQVITVLPFGNYIQTKALTGADLKAVLEHGVRAYPESLGGFPHVGGITFTFDPAKPAGQRVGSVLVKGVPLDLKKEYVVATNDFMAAGGDEYTMFAAYPILNDFASLEEAVIKYLQAHGEVNPKMEGRITAGVVTNPGAPEPVKPQPATPAPSAPKTYVVKPGDNLTKIAKLFNTTWQELHKLNKLKNPNLIYPNQVLILP